MPSPYQAFRSRHQRWLTGQKARDESFSALEGFLLEGKEGIKSDIGTLQQRRQFVGGER